MFSTIYSPIVSLWKMWAGSFSQIPYGDPYIAGITALLVLVVIAKIVLTLKQRCAVNSDSFEVQQMKTYRRAMNLR